ncbi:hypothetical protein TIFTF001_027560 [Ficus carica]|uniref:Uncharacterized protein n=1 Tax=Ficus carica TaxID=3494 RepID=A0AA88J0F3_FICCA|nr:hypothetical protein TIFTF001_027560 [Ficus carica]
MVKPSQPPSSFGKVRTTPLLQPKRRSSPIEKQRLKGRITEALRRRKRIPIASPSCPELEPAVVESSTGSNSVEVMSFPGRSSNPGYKERNVHSDSGSESEEDMILAFAACVIAWYRM